MAEREYRNGKAFVKAVKKKHEEKINRDLNSESNTSPIDTTNISKMNK
jgi:hypothetical protein